MKSLSTPIGQLQPSYGVVVVGSGYGGAVAAYRMASTAAKMRKQGLPGFSICVLERGLERHAGEYPSSLPGALRQVQAETGWGRFGRRTGLFDFRINPDVSVLVGCGLGGTSLINAGVMLEPAISVFTDARWPADLRQPGALRHEFDEVLRMLDAKPLPADVQLQKVTRLLEAGKGAPPQAAAAVVSAPRIAVSFETRVNMFNVQQQRCVLCGDCMTGCNHSAKNTVGMNYLPAAAENGTAIFCGIEVRSIEPIERDEWLLHLRLLDRAWSRFGHKELTIRAGMVFLAAGTLGSTEILLRSRHRLPMSSTLGQHFSGNGDAIAFGYNAPDVVDGIGYGRHVPLDASVGPTIGGMLDERDVPHSELLIQEGAVPGVLKSVLRFLAPVMARATHIPSERTFDFRFRHLWRELDSMIRGVRHGALARTQTFLVMSRDDGKGVLKLSRNRIRVSWRDAGLQPVFKRITPRLTALARATGSRYVINPFSSHLFGRRLMTVHPLGGCCLGQDAGTGVVDSNGCVFDGRGDRYETLRVCDGSIVPAALGANPALTIAALAERIVGNAAARADALPKTDSKEPGRITPSVPGLRYAERLRGWAEYPDERVRIELVLHISAESVDDLIDKPEHQACIIGVARIRTAHEDRHYTVTEGILNVCVEDPRTVDTRLMSYRMRLTPPTGKDVWLVGHKRLNLDTSRRGLWRVVTRLPFVLLDRSPLDIRPGRNDEFTAHCDRIDDWGGSTAATGRPAGVSGTGVVRNSIADVIRLMTSFEVTYEPRLRRRLRAVSRFVYFFVDVLFQARVWPLRRAIVTSPFTRPRLEPSAALKKGAVLTDSKKPGAPRFVLTQFTLRETDRDMDDLKPVILAPGFGMSTESFWVGKTSLVEHLCRQDYQVWLLDYRGSDRIDASLGQFTLDDLVDDFRDAFKDVHCRTRQQVRIVAHCVASLATFMTLLRGDGAGNPLESVHSVILSQSFAFIDYPLTNRIKAWLHLPQILEYCGFRVLTPDYDVQSSVLSRVLDRILHLYPSSERCSSGFCRRLLLLYGEVLHHDLLDQETHERLYDLFDRANLSVFKHVAKMVMRGHIVDVNGRNTYLTPECGMNINVPITLLHGERNTLFRRPGALRTHKWLLEHGGFGKDENVRQFKLETMEGFGHLDTFIGKDSYRKVFPTISRLLSAMEK